MRLASIPVVDFFNFFFRQCFRFTALSTNRFHSPYTSLSFSTPPSPTKSLHFGLTKCVLSCRAFQYFRQRYHASPRGRGVPGFERTPLLREFFNCKICQKSSQKSQAGCRKTRGRAWIQNALDFDFRLTELRSYFQIHLLSPGAIMSHPNEVAHNDIGLAMFHSIGLVSAEFVKTNFAWGWGEGDKEIHTMTSCGNLVIGTFCKIIR